MMCQAMKIEVRYSGKLLIVDVSEDTFLGALQKPLCGYFGQRFPFMKAVLVVENEEFDEFFSKPFSKCSEGGSAVVTFRENTDDPFFYDLFDRNPNHKWLL